MASKILEGNMNTAVNVTKFTNENLGLLHNAIDDALASIAKKWKVTFILTPITGGGSRASAGLSLTANTAEGAPEEALNWTERNLQALRLKKEWLGQTFTYSGQLRRGGRWHTDKYKITGLTNPMDKRPVIAVRIRDGEEYRFTVEAIRQHFEPEVIFKEQQAMWSKDWESYARKEGLNPAVLGKEYTTGVTFRVLGCDLKRSRAPIVCVSNLQRIDGCKDFWYRTPQELIAEFPEARG